VISWGGKEKNQAGIAKREGRFLVARKSWKTRKGIVSREKGRHCQQEGGRGSDHFSNRRRSVFSHPRGGRAWRASSNRFEKDSGGEGGKTCAWGGKGQGRVISSLEGTSTTFGKERGRLVLLGREDSLAEVGEGEKHAGEEEGGSFSSQ